MIVPSFSGDKVAAIGRTSKDRDHARDDRSSWSSWSSSVLIAIAISKLGDRAWHLR
jgi:hypothetical protein